MQVKMQVKGIVKRLYKAKNLHFFIAFVMRRSQVRIPSQAPLTKPHKLSVYAALLFLQRILFCNLKMLKNLKKLEVCKSVCKSNNIRKLIILHRLTTEFTTRFDIQTQVFSTFLWKFLTVRF